MAKKKTEGVQYIATQTFRDKDNFDVEYVEGADLSDLSEERIQELIGKGLINEFDPNSKPKAPKEPNAPVQPEVDPNANPQQ